MAPSRPRPDPPDEFIPVAEKSGLIVGIGRHVLVQACRQVVAAERDVRYLAKIAVNVSGPELERPDDADAVIAVLADSGLDPRRLVLEVTESSIAADGGAALAAADGVARAGVQIAIDDFGTGSSSLSRLTQLPVDIVKIDKAFVARIAAESPGP